MKTHSMPEVPAQSDDMQGTFVNFAPAPDLQRISPLDAETAKMLDTHLRAIDTVRIRVLGDDRSVCEAVEAHILSRGMGVEVSLSEQMIPPPRNRYVFRYDGRMAILTIAPDLP
ncbi:hypothetical protein [Falsirhodobacter deserti]|uniref:hypothetical protein n=1 Tax=Falsirhodobacter deserti TaxID=1365611 RepID=UPI000FE2CFE7|nr:hypothetical protein [Falsirhodobacter deserti]